MDGFNAAANYANNRSSISVNKNYQTLPLEILP